MRADVVAYRERFLLDIQRAERDDKVLIFGDGASVYIKERERFCWHLAGEKLYPLHESKGECLGIHSWATAHGLLEGSTNIWDIMWRVLQEGISSIDGPRCERMAGHCHGFMEDHWARFRGRKWGSCLPKKRRIDSDEGM